MRVLFLNEVHNNKLKILGKLAASLAHEIRNPLSALKLNLEYLNMSIDNFSKEDAECIQASLDAVERIQTLVDNTLAFSRKPKDDLGTYELNYIAKQAIEMIRSNANRKSIKIVTKFSSQIPKLKFNKDKILQVILNLLSNALEASPTNSQVLISTYFNENNLVVLEIKDEGVGIKEEDKNKIFSDFYTSKDKGTGLGLSVSKGLLKEHGAEVMFESESGEGTKFFIIFPKSLIEDEHDTEAINS